ncbi:MAG: glycosyltransferase [Patescibacteria group bacterium]
MQLKILIISSLQETTPPLGYGGTERFVHYLAEDLTKKGHNITVACRNGSIGGSYRKLELDTINLDVEFLLRDIEINDYDLIHLNTKIPSIINALSKLKIPVVVTFHNNFRKTSGWISIIKENYSNFYFTVISNSLKTRVIEALKLNNVTYPEHSIKDLSFGMDVFSYVEKYNSKVKRDYHLYIGVLARYKGVLDIVKTFIGSNENLVLVGPYNGSENKEYFDEVMKIVNDNENISYFGETKNEDEKIGLINGAKSLLVATGYDPLEADCYEAFGLVMLEANSLGTPVIGYAKGNVADYIVDDVNGFKFNNVSDISTLIKKLENKDLKDTCLKYAKQFDIEVISANYIEYFKNIIEGNI